MDKAELLQHLIDKVDDLFTTAEVDESSYATWAEGSDFRAGAKDYLLQVLDILVDLQKQESN
jgi:hypothetical protein